jgi:hypothetical protein
MEALTPASPGDLPPLGELVADEPFWRHPAWGLAAEGVAHLRIWTTATDLPGHVAVVTEIGLRAPVTESAGRIWADMVGRLRPDPELRRRLIHRTDPNETLSAGVDRLWCQTARRLRRPQVWLHPRQARDLLIIQLAYTSGPSPPSCRAGGFTVSDHLIEAPRQ